jgi:tRNA 2-selenouridine synthase SelU
MTSVQFLQLLIVGFLGGFTAYALSKGVQALSRHLALKRFKKLMAILIAEHAKVTE